jgi:hypothetical protein
MLLCKLFLSSIFGTIDCPHVLASSPRSQSTVSRQHSSRRKIKLYTAFLYAALSHRWGSDRSTKANILRRFPT